MMSPLRRITQRAAKSPGTQYNIRETLEKYCSNKRRIQIIKNNPDLIECQRSWHQMWFASTKGNHLSDFCNYIFLNTQLTDDVTKNLKYQELHKTPHCHDRVVQMEGKLSVWLFNHFFFFNYWPLLYVLNVLWTSRLGLFCPAEVVHVNHVQPWHQQKY